MAEIEITIDEQQIKEIASGRGLAALLRPVLNEILESEMTDHVGAEAHEGNELAADLEGKANRALETLELGLEEATAVLNLPDKYRRRLRTTNMVERPIEEVRRREKVIRIFPNDESAWRLLGAYLAERHEAWSTRRKYLKMEEFNTWKRSLESESDVQALAAE